MSETKKLSHKIHDLITTSLTTKGSEFYGKTWEWVRENTCFVEFYEDALQLERYIEALHQRIEVEA